MDKDSTDMTTTPVAVPDPTVPSSGNRTSTSTTSPDNTASTPTSNQTQKQSPTPTPTAHKIESNSNVGGSVVPPTGGKRRMKPYYAPTDHRPFSNSAAKRSSVLALGSIAHLQHHFAKHSLAAGRSKPHPAAVDTLPKGAITEEPLEEDLPPSPAPPPPRPSPYANKERERIVYPSWRKQRAALWRDLDLLCAKWGLVDHFKTLPVPASTTTGGTNNNNASISSGIDSLRVSRSPSPSPSDLSFEAELNSSSTSLTTNITTPTININNNNQQQQQNQQLPSTSSGSDLILDLIHTTTHTIRSVQRYLVNLPSHRLPRSKHSSAAVDDDDDGGSNSTGGGLDPYLSISTSTRPRTSLFQAQTSRPLKPRASLPFNLENAHTDSLSSSSDLTPSIVLNSSSLNQQQQSTDALITQLRRASIDVLAALRDMETRYRLNPENDEQHQQQQQTQTSVSQSIDSIGDPNPSSSTSTSSEDGSNIPTGNNGGASSINNGHLYRSDITLQDLGPQKDIVRAYVMKVDETLFASNKERKLRERRRQSRRLSNISNTSAGDASPSNRVASISSVTSDDKPQKYLGAPIAISEHGVLQTASSIDDEDVIHNSPSENDDDAVVEDDGDDDDDDDIDSDHSSNAASIPWWAKDDVFENDPLGRCHSCLVTYIPSHLLYLLISPREDQGGPYGFAECLSDGQLLCIAYNASLRVSSRPWGFVPSRAIHDIAGIKRESDEQQQQQQHEHDKQETSSQGPRFPAPPSLVDKRGNIEVKTAIAEATAINAVQQPTSPSSDKASASKSKPNSSNPSKVGMTYRRLENLRTWAAALKLRYSINLSNFDPKVVARHDQGWEDILLDAVQKWVQAVVKERHLDVKADH